MNFEVYKQIGSELEKIRIISREINRLQDEIVKTVSNLTDYIIDARGEDETINE